jgi:hypothetical protein
VEIARIRGGAKYRWHHWRNWKRHEAKPLKGITRKQAELIVMIHETLQGVYGEESRKLLYDSLLAWAKAEKLKRHESNKERKKNAKTIRSSKAKQKSNT